MFEPQSSLKSNRVSLNETVSLKSIENESNICQYCCKFFTIKNNKNTHEKTCRKKELSIEILNIQNKHKEEMMLLENKCNERIFNIENKCKDYILNIETINKDQITTLEKKIAVLDSKLETYNMLFDKEHFHTLEQNKKLSEKQSVINNNNIRNKITNSLNLNQEDLIN